jgi:hypothetical protein
MLVGSVVAYAATRRRLPSGIVGLVSAPAAVLIADGPGVVLIAVAATVVLIAAAHRRRYEPVPTETVPLGQP